MLVKLQLHRVYLFYVFGSLCSAAVNKETNLEVASKKIGGAFDNRIDAKRTLRKIKHGSSKCKLRALLPFYALKSSELLFTSNTCLIISIKGSIRPPRREAFSDVYIVYELMDRDLHKIIRSDQALTDDHCQVIPLITVHD